VEEKSSATCFEQAPQVISENWVLRLLSSDILPGYSVPHLRRAGWLFGSSTVHICDKLCKRQEEDFSLRQSAIELNGHAKLIAILSEKRKGYQRLSN
jgi:hypothetical protein